MIKKNLIVIGHSPGPGIVSNRKTSTLNRVRKWINEDYTYEWKNLVNYHAPTLRMSDVSLDENYVKTFDYVIALGNMASNWLTKRNINHLKVPHPSGLNRMWNNPQTEIDTIDSIKKYLHTAKSVV